MAHAVSLRGQGHHPFPLRYLACHAHGGWHAHHAHGLGYGFLLTKGEKMSKSRGNALKPADLVEVFGVDPYRYYFLSDVQFGS